MHRELFFNLEKEAGQIRNQIVAVGKYQGKPGQINFKVKHLPPFHARAEIIQALEQLSTWLDRAVNLPVTIKAGIFHHQFLYLPPFEDGNGRVCRTLTALIYLKGGYAINRYFVLDDYYDLDRTAYSNALHSADAYEKTQWLEYFSQGVRYSLQSALVKTKNALKTLSFKDRPTPRENQVLKLVTAANGLTSTDLATSLKVTRQQAHHLLRALVRKGLILRHGSTKSSYYTLN